MTLKDLGIRADNIIESTMAYAIFTIAGILLILVISNVLKRKPQPDFFKNNHFIYVFILVSLAQEFMFRGFLFPKLETIFSQSIIIILINAILFTLMHSIYSDDWKSLAMIFLGGICFAGIYLVYPNLIMITISHAVLNFIAVLYNFYHEENTNIKIVDYWSKIGTYWSRINKKNLLHKSR